MSVSEIIDPNTKLDSDVQVHCEMLGEMLQDPVVQKALTQHAATVEIAQYNRMAIQRGVKLLSKTYGKLGREIHGIPESVSPEWWKAFVFHVRSQIAYLLTDDQTRRNIALQFAFRRGRNVKATLKELRAVNRDVNLWLKEQMKRAERTNLIHLAGTES